MARGSRGGWRAIGCGRLAVGERSWGSAVKRNLLTKVELTRCQNLSTARVLIIANFLVDVSVVSDMAQLPQIF